MNRKITLAQCEGLYHLPVEQAANKLGVSRPTIARVMRQNGIMRWPYRTIRAQSKRNPSGSGSSAGTHPAFLHTRNHASSSSSKNHRSASPPRPPPRRSAAIPCPPPRRSQQSKKLFNTRSISKYQHQHQHQVVSSNNLFNSPASSTSDETMDDSDGDDGVIQGDNSGEKGDKEKQSLDNTAEESTSDCKKVAPSSPLTANTSTARPEKKPSVGETLTEDISSQCTKIVPPPLPSPPAAKKGSMNGVELLALVCENAPRRSSARLQALAAASKNSTSVVGECDEVSKVTFLKRPSPGSTWSGTTRLAASKSKFLENFIRAAASLDRVKFTVHGTDNGKLFIVGKFGEQLRLMKVEGRKTLSIMDEGLSLAAHIELDRVHYIDLIEAMGADEKPMRFVRILEEDLSIVVAATLSSATKKVCNQFHHLRNKFGCTMKLP